MKKMMLSLTFLMLQIANAAMAANDVDQAQLGASIAVLEAKNDIETNYQFCRTRAGNSGYQYDYAKYIWDLENRPYIRVSEKLFDGLPVSSSAEINQRWKHKADEFHRTMESARGDTAGKYCAEYFFQVGNGASKEFRVHQAVLASNLGSREDARILARNADMEIGCLKGGYNKGVKQFGAMKQACKCQTSLFVKKMSDRGIDDYLDLVAAKKSQDALALLAKKIAVADLQACYSHISLQ